MEGHAANPVVVLFAAAVLLCVLLGVYRRREAAIGLVRRLIVGELLFLGVTWIALQNHWTTFQAVLAGAVAVFVATRFMPASRSRYIRMSERRKVIGRFEAKTGRRYDPRIHHIHHKVPFSDGGNSTADNLEVIDASENLSRGASVPRWDLIGKRKRRRSSR
ncbi:MAG: HNH endonuclease signature motif containing protein [Terriglobia bacterium]